MHSNVHLLFKESSVKTCFQNKSNFATEDSFEHYNEIKFNQMKLYTTDNEGTSLTSVAHG